MIVSLASLLHTCGKCPAGKWLQRGQYLHGLELASLPDFRLGNTMETHRP